MGREGPRDRWKSCLLLKPADSDIEIAMNKTEKEV